MIINGMSGGLGPVGLLILGTLVGGIVGFSLARIGASSFQPNRKMIATGTRQKEVNKMRWVVVGLSLALMWTGVGLGLAAIVPELQAWATYLVAAGILLGAMANILTWRHSKDD